VLAALPDDSFLPVRYVRRLLNEFERDEREERLLTVTDVAARCGRSRSTVRGWCAAGELPGAFKLNGVAWRVPESALREFFEAQRDPTRSRAPALGPSKPPDLRAWRKERDG
jgi:excisionase family DNA binding protein